jgi:hypothetical protein
LDEKWLKDTYHSIIEQSISPNKLNQLTRQGGGIDICFSVTGKVISVRFFILKENIDILNENDWYTLYCNLKKNDMDMSKIEIEYSRHWVQGTEAYWGFSFPLKRKQS